MFPNIQRNLDCWPEYNLFDSSFSNELDMMDDPVVELPLLSELESETLVKEDYKLELLIPGHQVLL